jgi:hypothetical protein
VREKLLGRSSEPMLSRREGLGCYCGPRARAKREEGWKLARTDEVSRFMSACELIATMRSLACSAVGASSPGCNESCWWVGDEGQRPDQSLEEPENDNRAGATPPRGTFPREEGPLLCLTSAVLLRLTTSVNQSARCNQPEVCQLQCFAHFRHPMT